MDEAIKITWTSPSPKECHKLTLDIYDGDTLIESKQFSPFREKYTFSNGTHGTFYTISLNDNICYSMFLDFEQLPNIPIVTIDTLNGEDPPFTYADNPHEDYLGGTINDNEYVDANICITKNRETLYSDSAKVKLRGNTSSAWMMKKSYKMKLNHTADLLNEGSERSHREWVLLNSGVNINTYVGNFIGDKLNMEWNTHSTWVNVIVNGDWKGCYYLTEPVSFDTNPVGITEDGYIFENGAYFWKHDQAYFNLNNQLFGLGYSFVYPKMTTTNLSNKAKEDLDYIHTRMQTLEDSLLSPSSTDISYNEIIDVDSFAKWILARDIMGNDDGGGTNMYFYMKNHDSKIQMGPLWDFDNLFIREDRWSASHDDIIFYFPQLMQQQDFFDSYKAQWDNVKEDLATDIVHELTKLNNLKGYDLDESFILDETRWQYDDSHWPQHVTLMESQIDAAVYWFTTRKDWLDNALENLQ